MSRTHPDPSGSSVGENGPVLSPDAVDRWRTEGFAVVDGIFPDPLIEELRHRATVRFPEPGTPEAAATSEFGALTFPAKLSSFNQVTLHPRLLTAIAQLLDVAVGELRLTQSDLWPKYGSRGRTGGIYDIQDQRIHIDYPNHSLVHPAPWNRPEAVELILYLSDSEDCGGATAVVPRSGPDDPAYRWPIVDSPGIGDLRWLNDRTSSESYLAEVRPELVGWRQALYEREQLVRFTPGTVLFYRHDTWHRGTPLKPGGIRLAHNITYRRAECEWISTVHPGWAWGMYYEDQRMERLIASTTPDQRAVLGFPQPGSPYWCDETLEAVHARYGPLGFDIGPYQEGMA